MEKCAGAKRGNTGGHADNHGHPPPAHTTFSIFCLNLKHSRKKEESGLRCKNQSENVSQPKLKRFTLSWQQLQRLEADCTLKQNRRTVPPVWACVHPSPPYIPCVYICVFAHPAFTETEKNLGWR